MHLVPFSGYSRSRSVWDDIPQLIDYKDRFLNFTDPARCFRFHYVLCTQPSGHRTPQKTCVGMRDVDTIAEIGQGLNRNYSERLFALRTWRHDFTTKHTGSPVDPTLLPRTGTFFPE